VIGTDQVLDLLAGDADVAIRYAHTPPTGGITTELLRDTFWPVCIPELLSANGGLKRAADLRGQTLIHCDWLPMDTEAPTWRRWLSAARSKWRDVPKYDEMDHLSFREELHAMEAVIAGQGIGICSDVLVAHELTRGILVKAFDIKLLGYGFYLVHAAGHSRDKAIATFSKWLQAVR
jgi:LysR family glycine cleavage system transcriptional activator